MSGKKAGSDGQIRNTTAAWAADTRTYPEGMRLMDTDTGVVRVSKGTTYALAWVPASGPGSVTSDDVSNDSGVTGATVTAALDFLDEDKQEARSELSKLNVATGNVTAAAETDLGAQDGDHITIVGTTTITSFGTALAGIKRYITCGSATPITYDSENLVIPGSASITTAPGDTFTAISYGGGVWQIFDYQRRDGSPLVSEVDNDLSASTTRAGSKTAINTALALKAAKPVVAGTAYGGTYSYDAVTAGGGKAIIDLTAATPALSAAVLINAIHLDNVFAVARPSDATLASFEVDWVDASDVAIDGLNVRITVAGNLATP